MARSPATAVQNPLTTLEESVAAAQRALAQQEAPMVLVGHSFSGMIVTEDAAVGGESGVRTRGAGTLVFWVGAWSGVGE